MKFIFVITFVIWVNFIHSQNYYGDNDFGKLEFINDTICLAYFINTSEFIDNQICYYQKSNDTIFLSTRIKNPFEIIINNDEHIINCDSPILTKQYRKNNEGYKLVDEFSGGFYDVEEKQIVYNFISFDEGDIIVIKEFIFYRRLRWDKNERSRFSMIKCLDNGVDNSIYFNNFPLLMKGNKLIPIDKDENEKCWINNGFYFPVMTKSKKEKEIKTIPRWTIGLQGLPCGISVSEPF
jgi:hypothetical protein